MSSVPSPGPVRVGRGRRQIGISPPVQDELALRDYLEIAAEAERLGFEWLFLGEVAGPDAFTLLGSIATTTHRIGLATGVVSTFTRPPATLAMSYAGLHDLAPGRVMAGIGAGTRLIADDWNDVPFDRPLGRARDVVEVLRRLFRGERVTYEGATFEMNGFRLTPPDVRDVPVMLAGIQTRMLAVAGAVADVAYLAFCPEPHLPERIGVVRQAAVAAGRDPDSVGIALSLNVYAGSDLETARRRVKKYVLRYSSVPTHWAGFGDVQEQLAPARELWQRGEQDAAIEAVPDSAAESVCAVSTGEELMGRIERCWEAGVDLVILQVLGAHRGDGTGPLETVAAVGAARSSIPTA